MAQQNDSTPPSQWGNDPTPTSGNLMDYLAQLVRVHGQTQANPVVLNPTITDQFGQVKPNPNPFTRYTFADGHYIVTESTADGGFGIVKGTAQADPAAPTAHKPSVYKDGAGNTWLLNPDGTTKQLPGDPRSPRVTRLPDGSEAIVNTDGTTIPVADAQTLTDPITGNTVTVTELDALTRQRAAAAAAGRDTASASTDAANAATASRNADTSARNADTSAASQQNTAANDAATQAIARARLAFDQSTAAITNAVATGRLKLDEATQLFDEAYKTHSLALQQQLQAITQQGQYLSNASSLASDATTMADASLPYLAPAGTAAALSKGWNQAQSGGHVDVNMPTAAFPFNPATFASSVAAHALKTISPLAAQMSGAPDPGTGLSAPLAGPAPGSAPPPSPGPQSPFVPPRFSAPNVNPA